jgi:hypothetical protein
MSKLRWEISDHWEDQGLSGVTKQEKIESAVKIIDTDTRETLMVKQ